jgi:hypothetical protein
LAEARGATENTFPGINSTPSAKRNSMPIRKKDFDSVPNIIKFEKKMQAIELKIEKRQFLKMLSQLNENDRFEIYNELKKSLFLKRFNQLLKTTRTNELSLEDITNEVESVRKRRYEKGEQIL